jgi:hypothetical protein
MKPPSASSRDRYAICYASDDSGDHPGDTDGRGAPGTATANGDWSGRRGDRVAHGARPSCRTQLRTNLKSSETRQRQVGCGIRSRYLAEVSAVRLTLASGRLLTGRQSGPVLC